MHVCMHVCMYILYIDVNYMLYIYMRFIGIYLIYLYITDISIHMINLLIYLVPLHTSGFCLVGKREEGTEIPGVAPTSSEGMGSEPPEKQAPGLMVEILQHLIRIRMYCTTIIHILLVYGVYIGPCRNSTINRRILAIRGLRPPPPTDRPLASYFRGLGPL